MRRTRARFDDLILRKSKGFRSMSSPLSQGGQYESFEPADYVKENKQGLIQRILNLFIRSKKEPEPGKTTEQGAASAASVSTYQLALLQERYERREIITDARIMVQDEPRARRSSLKFAREAVRKGCVLSVNPKANEGVSKTTIRVVEECLERVQKILTAEKLTSWAWMLIVEGDLFVQAIVGNGKVVNAKRMPAISMERLTDDTDEFINPERAYSQLDTMTNAVIADFPVALIYHARWCHVDGDRYGVSELISGRRMKKLLELEEEAQAVRRMTRATNRTLWNVGTPENPVTDKRVIEEFKEENGFVEGVRDIFDPLEIARDFFGNGSISMETLPADTSVSDVEDLKYQQNVYASAALPTPPPLYNLDAESVNRDVLDDLRAEWLKETSVLTEDMSKVVRYLVDLDLLLHGVLPETVHYDVTFSESSIEKPSEVVSRVLELRKNATGDFQPDPLVTKRKALSLLADILDIDDVDSELEALDKETEEKFSKQLEQQEQVQALESEKGPEKEETNSFEGAEGQAPLLSSLMGGPGGQQQATGRAGGDSEEAGKDKNVQWVTIGKKKIPITNGSVGENHIKEAKEHFGLSDKSHSMLMHHRNKGAIRTDRDLYHGLAIAQAMKGAYPNYPEESAIHEAFQSHGADPELLQQKAQSHPDKLTREYHKKVFSQYQKEQGLEEKNAQVNSGSPERSSSSEAESNLGVEANYFSKQFDIEYPDDVIEAVESWVGNESGGYSEVNKFLRGQESIATPEAKKTIEGLDKALSLPSSVVSKRLKTHRMLSFDKDSESFTQYSGLKPGDTFTDKGFVAVSYDPAKNPSGNVNLHITVPRGSRGLWVDGVVGDMAEKELLLPRNSEFKVSKVIHTAKSVEIHAELSRK